MLKIFYNNKNYYNFFIFITIFFLSIFIFRGRLGSDDLEVFNFVYNFDQFEGTLIEYLKSLEEGKKLFFSDEQKHGLYTLHHRFTWILQTGIVYFFSKYIFLIFNIENYFVIQYLCGFVLTIQAIISIFLFSSILIKKGLETNLSFFISFIIFFGTGIICFFTGQYIEAVAILLILLYIKYINNNLRFLFSILLVLIKPFYILIILSLSLKKIEKKFIFFNKQNLAQLKDTLLTLIFYFVVFFIITDLGTIKNYFSSQNPTNSISIYLNNLFNFYFSFGAGLLFTSTIPIIMIYIGSNKITIFKFLPIFLMSFLLSPWEGFHGGVQGIRYLLPFLFIFMDEYISAINKILRLKKYFIIWVLFILTIINLPSLEFRNFVISEYQNATIKDFKPTGPAKLEKNNLNEYEYEYYSWPIKNFKFNNLIFSNYIFYSKLLNKPKIKISNISFNTTDVFPQTGIGRLIYIKKNNININQKKIIKFIDKFYFTIKFFYYFIIIFFIFCMLINLKKVLRFNEKN